MKRSLLFIAVIGLSVSGLNAQCDNVLPGQVTFENDPTACDAYYTCVGPEAFPQRCPPPLHFFQAQQRCDFPNEDGQCFECPAGGNNINFPVLDSTGRQYDCKMYRVCFLGESSLRECSEGLQFNPLIGQCDLTSIVGCVTNTCPFPDVPGFPTFLPHPTKCEQYYLCRNGAPDTTNPLSCPTGTAFNREQQRCVPDPLCFAFP